MSKLQIICKSFLYGLVNRGVRLGKKPSRFLYLILILKDLVRLRKPDISGIKRFITANSIEATTLETRSNLPSIESLVVSTSKDFEVLALCIPNIVESSFNQITRISIIVPNSDMQKCQLLIDALEMDVPIELIDEDSYLPIELRNKIRRLFGTRYGWVLQQILTVEFIRRSEATGVLVVNSDTILLERLVWLDDMSLQLLMPSWEFNQPYYDFLEQLNPSFAGITQSFISHHMLMQPVLFRKTLTEIGIDSLEELLQKVEIHADLSSSSPICLEFEIYAQGLLVFNRERALISKWSNIGVSRTNGDVSLEEIARLKSRKQFRSVSIHSWS